MTHEVERRLKCLDLYADPPEGLAEAVQRARALGDGDEIAGALAAIERACFAVEIGAIRRDRARLEFDGAALPPAVGVRVLLERLAGALPDRLRRFVLTRAYAALPASAIWNLREFEVVSLRPALTARSPDAEPLDGDGERLARALSQTLGAGLLAPPRVAQRLSAMGATKDAPRGYGAIVRWVERTGAPVLPVDLSMKDEPSATPRVLRRRQEEIVRLIGQDLRIG